MYAKAQADSSRSPTVIGSHEVKLFLLLHVILELLTAFVSLNNTTQLLHFSFKVFFHHMLYIRWYTLSHSENRSKKKDDEMQLSITSKLSGKIVLIFFTHISSVVTKESSLFELLRRALLSPPTSESTVSPCANGNHNNQEPDQTTH